ncbi:MgtC/SapB family protein [Rhodopila sp.]|jgi:putative Mg2+ transporter-C (MgtC) family protein|uniref:MgtC/SapB family protein n=1 Tax=Rhodopila sp. TaxID=2480087 RepID=UPI002CC277AD|nr:MgtC/SapB family protein [Rhodopila sp.]HVZ06991.1 MgtC/SapB family protein [Rhodopila sp.]
MPLQPDWSDIALRLLLAVLSGMALGYDRGERGKAAGMRTTLLVCLAACVAMIQVNLLLALQGRSQSSFVMNDLMRLPLGILTGVGFIGGGVILRRGNAVLGVTTAATLWLATVVGLCLGGDQLVLGLVATGLGLVTLFGLGWVKSRLSHQMRARLIVETANGGPREAELRDLLTRPGMSIASARVSFDRASDRQVFEFEVQHCRRAADTAIPGFVDALAKRDGVLRLVWQEQDR